MKSNDQEQLEGIKRLLIALLLKLGASSQEIAVALGVDSSVVRKMFPMRAIKAISVPK